MTSVYALRLYELLVEEQWKGIGEREIEIDWLKERFQIVEEYKEISNLKRRVIDPAVAQVNEHSNINATYSQKKEGRNVVAFVFSFSEKITPEAEQPKRPPYQPKPPVSPAMQPPAFKPEPFKTRNKTAPPAGLKDLLRAVGKSTNTEQ